MNRKFPRHRPFLTARGALVLFAVLLFALAVGFFAALAIQGG